MEDFKEYDNKTPYFKLIGIKNYCRVVDIYDGDTLTVILKIFNSQYFKFNVRLSGIDTCEIHSCNENKDKAIQARNRLFELITNKKFEYFDFKTKKELKEFFNQNVFLVWIECEDFDKYGRLLAQLFKEKDENLSFSQILLSEKLAYEYDGGKKLSEEKQLHILNQNNDQTNLD